MAIGLLIIHMEMKNLDNTWKWKCCPTDCHTIPGCIGCCHVNCVLVDKIEALKDTDNIEQAQY